MHTSVTRVDLEWEILVISGMLLNHAWRVYTEHTNCHGGLDILLTALNICMSILDLRVFAVWIFIDTMLR